MSSKEPTKVTVECTADGWTTTAYAGDEVIASRTMTMASLGSAKATKKGDFFDDFDCELEWFADVMADIQDDAFGVTISLARIREGH